MFKYCTRNISLSQNCVLIMINSNNSFKTPQPNYFWETISKSVAMHTIRTRVKILFAIKLRLNFFTISVKLEDRKKFSKEARIGLAQDLKIEVSLGKYK